MEMHFHILSGAGCIEQDPVFIKAVLLFEEALLENRLRRCSLGAWLCPSLWLLGSDPFREVPWLSSAEAQAWGRDTS